MDETSVKKFIWIDCAKALAIFAVLIDHTNGVLYHNSGIGVISFYSVSVFILVMGITTYISEMRYKDENVWDRIKKRIGKIFWPYAAATFVYSVAADHMFHFENFINRLLHFNASSPFYYVFLYLQLIFVNAFLYQVIQKCNRVQYSGICKLAVGTVLLAAASFTTNYSNMLDIYGGGGQVVWRNLHGIILCRNAHGSGFDSSMENEIFNSYGGMHEYFAGLGIPI